MKRRPSTRAGARAETPGGGASPLLPGADIPEDVRQADDAFWKDHERARLERTSQPCCTLSGIIAQLARLPGRLCVVVHGEKDCLNSFRAFQGPRSAHLFCTRLTERECIAGRSAARLGQYLESIARDKQPELIVVLGTCLIELLGEDTPAVLADASRRLDPAILFLRTSGLKCRSEQEMLDMLWSALADWSLGREPRPERTRGAGEVFVFGLPASSDPRGELRRILDGCGLGVHASFPGAASLDDWKGLARAEAVFVVDRAAYPATTRRLAQGGIDVIEVPLPVGLKQSRAFFEAIAGRFRKRARVRRVMAGAVAAARRAIASFRKEFGPRRLAYAMRMGAYYEADWLAYGGLGDLACFTELGFRPTLLVQGSEDPKSRAFHAEHLGRLGHRGPFRLFSDPYMLLQLLREERFDLAYCSRNAFRQDDRIDLPFIETRSLEPFFEGVLANVERVRRALRMKG